MGIFKSEPQIKKSQRALFFLIGFLVFLIDARRWSLFNASKRKQRVQFRRTRLARAPVSALTRTRFTRRGTFGAGRCPPLSQPHWRSRPIGPGPASGLCDSFAPAVLHVGPTFHFISGRPAAHSAPGVNAAWANHCLLQTPRMEPPTSAALACAPGPRRGAPRAPAW